jgi:hypothetical protein
MKTKQSKPPIPAQQERRNTDAFLWHFQPSPFSHVHWWKAGESVPLEAAVWELIRRHPDAKATRAKMHGDVLLKPLAAFVGCHCFKAWRELGKSLQAAFVRRLWKEYQAQHGFIAPPVAVLNDHRPFQNYYRQLETGGQKTRLAESAKRLALHVSTSAIESHLVGLILIAVDPNAPPARIAKGVTSAVADWQNGRQPMDTGKARIGQWLDVIASFEKSEISRQKKQIRNDQLFARYRRAIQDWPLPS